MSEDEFIKKCGNCLNITPQPGTIAENNWQKEVNVGKCKISGKKVIGSLIAGCFYWQNRNTERVD